MTEAARRAPLIELHQVSKAYRGRIVFAAEHLLFERGLSYALIGANGSGKSTLLRLLAGAIAPDAGRIVRHELDGAHDIAYLPQHPYIFSLSALRNLTMAISGVSREEKQRLALAMLEQVGIAGLAASRGSRLSGGEGQRLSVARVLVQAHKLLLLDEPTSSTDIAGNELIEQALAAYLAGNDCELIFATHALSQAERIADRVLFFSAGQIVESGPAEQVLRAPQSEECQAFLRFWRGK